MLEDNNAPACPRGRTVREEETQSVSGFASRGNGDRRVLDLERVLETVAGFCRTEMGRERARAMRPESDRSRVSRAYDRVDEAIALEDEPPLDGIADVRPLLARARAEASLSGRELLAVSRACVGIRECRQFLRRRQERAPLLWQLGADLCEQAEFESAVEHALDEKGEVRDSATPALAEARRESRRIRNRLVERLEAMASAHPDWCSDRPTVRRDRFVLAVRVEARDRLSGVVHDTSDSGQTLFVEPMETVNEQNRLAELRGAEAEETERVLRSLSGMVARVADELARSLDAAGALDLVAAKRRFSFELDCVRPGLSEDGRVELVAGRHPLLLLKKSAVVPLDFRMPDGVSVVLVSGPNAGGKTVVIKTLGLFCLMAGCGLPVPAAPGTRLPLFARVFADIGDEQSIDDGLSSFTAHVTRLKAMLDNADASSLVLLDEIGSSTAPEEGAALAVAVLETLRDRRVSTVATSHFGALKMFVQDEPGMVNAAMGFRGGRPTYRLGFGFPGESSALEIAARAGLGRDLLERAASRLGREWLDMGEKLRKLDAELEATQRAHAAAEMERAQAARLKVEFEREREELAQRVASERDRLKQEREVMLLGARREIENLVRRIRESQAERTAVVEAKRFVERQLEVDRAQETGNGIQDTERAFAVGDVVESRSYHKRGIVAEVKDGVVTVAFGSIRMRLEPRDLVAVDGEVPPPARSGAHPVEDEPGFAPELNVIGMSGEEADEAVGRFLDEARYRGAGAVTIVHGRGTGVLQRVVRDHLRRDASVQEFRYGEPFEGGDGATFVTMKREAEERTGSEGTMGQGAAVRGSSKESRRVKRGSGDD